MTVEEIRALAQEMKLPYVRRQMIELADKIEKLRPAEAQKLHELGKKIMAECGPGLITDLRTYVTAELFDPETGQQATVEHDYDFGHPLDAIEYKWCDGNFSCDCNRKNMIYNDTEDYPCDHTVQLRKLTVTKMEGRMCQIDLRTEPY